MRACGAWRGGMPSAASGSCPGERMALQVAWRACYLCCNCASARSPALPSDTWPARCPAADGPSTSAAAAQQEEADQQPKFLAFAGAGRRLDGKAVSASNPVPIPMPGRPGASSSAPASDGASGSAPKTGARAGARGGRRGALPCSLPRGGRRSGPTAGGNRARWAELLA